MAAMTTSTGASTSYPDVVIVADAGSGVGLGHIARCSAIAAGLGVRGVSCLCLAVGAQGSPHSAVHWAPIPSAADIPRMTAGLLLLDSYLLAMEAVRLRLQAPCVVAMHDLGPVSAVADLTVTTDPRIVGTGPAIVGGAALTCLGPSFWGLPDPGDAPQTVKRVLVTTGGGDPGGHAVATAINVQAALPDADVVLVRGPNATFGDPGGVRVLDAPASLLEPLRWADLVVSSAGSSLMEAMAVGVPALGLVLADNQRPTAQGLVDAGATELFGPDQPTELAAAVSRLAADAGLRRERVRRGRRLVDGYGALRVSFLLWRLARPVGPTDDAR
jgi:spore coat polysaccharide biosynthesis predicted glycosyltransferase SpsG